MEIKFKIFRFSKEENQEVLYYEKILPVDDNQEIKFGRIPGNDIVLKDESNLVSGKHAILKFQSGKFSLQDLGSMNKTFTNGRQLAAQQTVDVTPDTKIEMANFIINFTLIEPPDVSELNKEPAIQHPSEGEESIPGSNDGQEGLPKIEVDLPQIAEELRTVYQQHRHNSAELRQQKLIEFLSQKIKHLEKSEVRIFFEQLKQQFPDQIYDLKTLQKENEELKKKVSQWSGAGGVSNAAFQALNDIANDLVEPGTDFQSENDVTRFCQNIKNTIENLLSFFSDLDKGRKQILEDFIDIWNQKEYESPLLSKTPKEMLKVLLDWRMAASGGSNPKMLLERSLQIFIIHEMSLLKGYQEATYRGSQKLLEYLDPKSIAFQISKREINLGFIKLPYKYIPFLVQILTWKEFLKRHKELKNEDPSKFESIFRPSFAMKYRETVASSNESRRNLNETRMFYRENLQTIKQSGDRASNAK